MKLSEKVICEKSILMARLGCDVTVGFSHYDRIRISLIIKVANKKHRVDNVSHPKLLSVVISSKI